MNLNYIEWYLSFIFILELSCGHSLDEAGQPAAGGTSVRFSVLPCVGNYIGQTCLIEAGVPSSMCNYIHVQRSPRVVSFR